MTIGGPQVGVGAIVVKGDALLMVKRGKEPALGLWSVPGGRVEQGEQLKDAVRREVKEETGLDVEVADFAGVYESMGEPHFVILDYRAEPIGDADPVAAADAADARWVPFADIAHLECTPRLVETLRGWGVLPE